jgi:hypothetical protein
VLSFFPLFCFNNLNGCRLPGLPVCADNSVSVRPGVAMPFGDFCHYYFCRFRQVAESRQNQRAGSATSARQKRDFGAKITPIKLK